MSQIYAEAGVERRDPSSRVPGGHAYKYCTHTNPCDVFVVQVCHPRRRSPLPTPPPPPPPTPAPRTV